MSEMTSPTGTDAEITDLEPMEAVKAAVYVVGFVGETDRVLSESDMPEDDTIVWLESNPEDRVTLAELDDRMGEGVIEYDSEPQPFEGAAMAAALTGSYGSDLDTLEAQLASLEGVVAGVMLDALQDERFLDDEDDLLTQERRTMQSNAAARQHLQAMAAAVKEIADVGDEMVAGREDPNIVASDEEVTARISEMRDRLSKLEARIAEMMDESMEDAELVDSDDMVVDERDL